MKGAATCCGVRPTVTLTDPPWLAGAVLYLGALRLEAPPYALQAGDQVVISLRHP